MVIHASTQTGIVNYVTANELYNMGCKRVVLARELSLDEIAEIRARTPKDLEIECFVHGAMCVSFSGTLSAFKLPCKTVMPTGENVHSRAAGDIIFRRKKGLMSSILFFEDEQGTYILNAKDMSMIEPHGTSFVKQVYTVSRSREGQSQPTTFQWLQTPTEWLWTAAPGRVRPATAVGFMTRYSR
ncbi:U32 family peptidase [Ruminococcus sp. HUN007]|uniref:U32 family peptidase n=1 Tax=Ruminococcus sp. HUN007 TaxID=1514668 RepID=UPI000A7430AD|nr:U32 family peptidase [Ruminococcus sp. HUN007]